MNLTRYPDWVSRLEVFLRENAHRPFRYGEWDCCLFVCSALEAMTGTDLAEGLRGRYDSAASAMALVRSVSAIAAERAAEFGMREVSIGHAGRGDVVLVRRARGYSLGLMGLDGQFVLVLAGSRGVAQIPRFAGVRAWTV